jgi:hypothetical protein
MTDVYFAGMRATSDLVTDEDPESWRPGILRLFPNGDAPLTALTNMMKSTKVPSTIFHWWTKTLNTQRAAITALWDDALLTVAYTGGTGIAGSIVYLQMVDTATVVFREGQQVLIRDASNYTVDVNAMVIDVVVNGVNSYIAVRLLEIDDNGVVDDMGDADTVMVIGSINPQGGTRPEALSQGPSEFHNRTQIFRDSLDITRTLMETTLRTVDAYTEVKRDALELHSIQLEKALLWGIQTNNLGINGKPQTTTHGLIPFIRDNGGTLQDFSLDAGVDYVGKTWLQAGEQWIDEHLEEIFRFGSTERLAFCGSGALLGIQRLVKNGSAYNIAVREAAFGIKVVEWITPFGQIYLKRHPLFSYEATNRNSMVLFEPANLKYNYITDTMFKPDAAYPNSSSTGVDGKQEEFITECGLEFHFPNTCGYLNSVGIDNVLP